MDSIIFFVSSDEVSGVDDGADVDVLNCFAGTSGGVTVVSFFMGGAGGVL